MAYDRSPSKNIYLSVAVNTLKKLRGLVPSAAPSLSKASGRRVVSHEVVLGGKLAAKTSFSLSRPSSPRVEELKGELATADPCSLCPCLSVLSCSIRSVSLLLSTDSQCPHRDCLCVRASTHA